MSTEPREAPCLGIKPPPKSDEAEQSLLGAVLLSDRCYDLVADRVRRDWFWLEKHRLIWQAIEEIAGEGQRPDVVMVTEWFARREQMDRVDSGAYITQLANEVPSTANVKGWARIVGQHYQRRRLIEVLDEVQDAAWTHDEPLEFAVQQLHALESRDGGDAVPVPQAVAAWLEHMDRLSSGEVLKIDTGLVDVDRQIGPLHGGNLIIVAGRPGTGKSIHGLQVARHNARHGRPALVFSLEMTLMELITRMVAGGGVESDRLSDPSQLTADDWRLISQVVAELKGQRNLLIDETPGLSVEQLRIRARRAKRLHGIQLVVVDYLQLLQSTRRHQKREEEVAEVSRTLKAIAKELNVPVMALAQLNRKMEERVGGAKRPVMADLRESGQIEQDADIIQFLYFNGQYDEDDTSGILEIITRKHRNGPTGTSLVGYQPHRFRFANADLQEIGQYRREVMAPAGNPRRSKKPKGFGLGDDS